MATHYLKDGDGKVTTILTMADIFQFGGFIFEFHGYCGPMKLKKDFEPAKREGRKFFQAIAAWQKLAPEEKEATRISG